MMGKNTHNHAAPIGGMVATRIEALIEMEASNDVFKPASEVVNDVLLILYLVFTCKATLRTGNPSLVFNSQSEATLLNTKPRLILYLASRLGASSPERIV